MTQPAAMIGHHTLRMADPQAPPEYKLYRTRPRLPRRGGDDGSLLDDLREAPPGERRRKPITVGRVVKWLLLALVVWVGLSLVLFLISAQVNQDQVSAAAQAQLSGGGVGILKPQTTLILGSDQRTAANKEPGASTSGPSRSDSILLVRTGGGHSAKLSIPRDTVVDIPGHGRNKINAAYAFGGAALDRPDDQAVPRHPDRPRLRGQLRQLPRPGRRDGRDRLHRRLRRLAHQRRLQERRLHAAPAPRHDAHRRQAGARPRAHAPQRVQPQGGRPHARAPPAEGHQRDEVTRVQPGRLRSPAVHLLERAQDAQDRHARPGAAGLRDRDRDQRRRHDARSSSPRAA